MHFTVACADCELTLTVDDDDSPPGLDPEVVFTAQIRDWFVFIDPNGTRRALCSIHARDPARLGQMVRSAMKGD